MFSHRFHRSAQMLGCVGSPTESTEFTEVLAEIVLPQISQNSQNFLQRLFSHRFHRSTQIVWVPSRGCTCLKCTNVTRGISILLGWCTSCSGKRQSRAETSAPSEVGRFCEFCAICGSYFAVAEAGYLRYYLPHPNHLCKSVQSVGGPLFARLVHLRQVHPLKLQSVEVTLLLRRQGYLRYYLPHPTNLC